MQHQQIPQQHPSRNNSHAYFNYVDEIIDSNDDNATTGEFSSNENNYREESDAASDAAVAVSEARTHCSKNPVAVKKEDDGCDSNANGNAATRNGNPDSNAATNIIITSNSIGVGVANSRHAETSEREEVVIHGHNTPLATAGVTSEGTRLISQDSPMQPKSQPPRRRSRWGNVDEGVVASLNGSNSSHSNTMPNPMPAPDNITSHTRLHINQSENNNIRHDDYGVMERNQQVQRPRLSSNHESNIRRPCNDTNVGFSATLNHNDAINQGINDHDGNQNDATPIRGRNLRNNSVGNQRNSNNSTGSINTREDSNGSTNSSSNNNSNNNFNKSDLMELTSEHASRTTFPPGCHVVYNYNPDIAGIASDGGVHICMGTVRSVSINLSSTTRELIHEIEPTKVKASTAAAGRRLAEEEEADAGKLESKPKKISTHGNVVGRTGGTENENNMLWIDETALAYAPLCRISCQPNSVQINSRSDVIEGLVLLCQWKNNEEEGGSSKSMRDEKVGRNGRFVYTILLNLPDQEGHLVKYDIGQENLSFCPTLSSENDLVRQNSQKCKVEVDVSTDFQAKHIRKKDEDILQKKRNNQSRDEPCKTGVFNTDNISKEESGSTSGIVGNFNEDGDEYDAQKLPNNDMPSSSSKLGLSQSIHERTNPSPRLNRQRRESPSATIKERQLEEEKKDSDSSLFSSPHDSKNINANRSTSLRKSPKKRSAGDEDFLQRTSKSKEGNNHFRFLKESSSDSSSLPSSSSDSDNDNGLVGEKKAKESSKKRSADGRDSLKNNVGTKEANLQSKKTMNHIKYSDGSDSDSSSLPSSSESDNDDEKGYAANEGYVTNSSYSSKSKKRKTEDTTTAGKRIEKQADGKKIPKKDTENQSKFGKIEKEKEKVTFKEFKLDWKKGCVISLSGLPAKNCYRDSIRNAVTNILGISNKSQFRASGLYISFTPGETKGYLRLSEPKEAEMKELVNKLNEGSVLISGAKVKSAKILKGVKEEKYYEDFIGFVNDKRKLLFEQKQLKRRMGSSGRRVGGGGTSGK